MALRLSALRAGRPLPPERFLVLISVWVPVGPRAIVRLEGLSKLKKSTLWGLEPVTFRLVAKCLNQLRYRVPPFISVFSLFRKKIKVDLRDLHAVCVYVYPPIVARQRLGIQIPAVTNTWNKEEFAMQSASCQRRVCGSVGLYVYSQSLLGNGSVNTFSREQRHVEGVLFYAVYVVS
jgi:hypothetical protein